MHIHLSQFFVALALSPVVTAVSLADFKPRADNLPSACDKVYKATISGCQASDFTGATCGARCIKALQSYVSTVQKACSGQQGTNIITAFLTASGPSQLCSNAPSSPSSSSAAPPSSTPTSSSSSTASVEAGSSTSPSPASSSSATSATEQTSSTTVPSNGQATSQPAPSSSAPAPATPASGGYGSPFDTASNSVAASASRPMKASLALVGALAFGLLTV